MNIGIAVEGSIRGLTENERERLLSRSHPDSGEIAGKVRSILARVREEGDAALLRMAREYDGVSLADVDVPRPFWRTALAELDPELRAALEVMVRNVRTFHEAQVPEDRRVAIGDGILLRWRAVPLDRVGVYAPGGRASYPSSVIMGVAPARAAGVREVVVCSPPGPDGRPPQAVLAAAEMAGADRVFALGGAGAIAALAYGTRSVPPCQAIVGPGNRWVTEAKRQVAGSVRIDAPAGPSEVLVLADETVDARLVAGELIAQAEHDPEAAVALVTWEPSVLRDVRAALAVLAGGSPRREIVLEALSRRGALLLASGREEAVAFAQDYAAEHLAVYTRDPEGDAEELTTAGTVFLGQASSVVFGDYVSGANHVLPTGGLAHAYSGLSVLDFIRVQTLQTISAETAARLAPDVEVMARAEGLPGHAAAAGMRRET